MSGCGNSNCGCGANCSCGSSCGCGKYYPDVEKTTTANIIIEGVAPVKTFFEGSEKSFGTEGGNTCKCGPNCSCNPCKC